MSETVELPAVDAGASLTPPTVTRSPAQTVDRPDRLFELLAARPVRRPTVLWDESTCRAEFARAAELSGFAPTVRKAGA